MACVPRCATGFASAGAIVGLSEKSGSQDDELQAKGSQKSLAEPGHPAAEERRGWGFFGNHDDTKNTTKKREEKMTRGKPRRHNPLFPPRPLRFSSPRLEGLFFRCVRGVVVVHFLSEPCFGTEAREEREDPLLRLRVLGGLLLNRAPSTATASLIREDPRQSAADFLASQGNEPRIRAEERGSCLAVNDRPRAIRKGAHRAPYAADA